MPRPAPPASRSPIRGAYASRGDPHRPPAGRPRARPAPPASDTPPGARETSVVREAPAIVARAAIVARERAMLLLSFGAALRRSELVARRAAASSSWCAARRPTRTARGTTLPSGPIRTNPASARSPHRAGSRLDRHPDRARRTPAVLRRHQGRPGHRRASRTRRSPAWSSRRRATPGSTRSATPGTACAPGSPPPPANAGAGLAELMRQTRHAVAALAGDRRPGLVLGRPGGSCGQSRTSVLRPQRAIIGRFLFRRARGAVSGPTAARENPQSHEPMWTESARSGRRRPMTPMGCRVGGAARLGCRENPRTAWTVSFPQE